MRETDHTPLVYKIKNIYGLPQWHTFMVPATQKAGIRRIMVKDLG
jgi:hypothetical protein